MLSKHIIRTLTMFLLCLFLLAACRRQDTSGSNDKAPAAIRIGSKNFTEQLLLGEMMAQMMEAHSRIPVRRTFNLGGTMICHNALKDGELDIYAEYTGTALTAILKQDVISDPDAAYELVNRSYQEQFACRWLQPFGFNNTYAITLRAQDSREKNLQSISDLRDISGELSAGFTAEFMERPDGYPGLRERYNIQFRRTRDMEPALMYQAIAQGDVDVICAFATDGRIAKFDLQMLLDDKAFFPPYYAAPVVRQAILEKHPEIQDILNRLSGKIDNAKMQQLNHAVDEGGRSAAEVVAEFLQAEGLLGAIESDSEK